MLNVVPEQSELLQNFVRFAELNSNAPVVPAIKHSVFATAVDEIVVAPRGQGVRLVALAVAAL